jgi:hypothetical protein
VDNDIFSLELPKAGECPVSFGFVFSPRACSGFL